MQPDCVLEKKTDYFDLKIRINQKELQNAVYKKT